MNATPPEPAADRFAHAERSTVSHTHGTRKVRRILVVDDTTAIRESLAKVLRAEGYEVTLAASGFEALNCYDPGQTDIVILDLGLPGIDGWTAFQGIMALNSQQAVVFISGQVNGPTWTAAAYSGVFLPKPLDVPSLLHCLKEMFVETSHKRCERAAVQTDFVRVTKPCYGAGPRFVQSQFGGSNH